MELQVMNVNEALAEGYRWLASSGVEEDSRNGKVLVSPEPVLTTYRFPMERVLFSPRRDANPYFHLMESLWMLSGSDEIAFPTMFNSKFKQYSDDGETQHGAYGFRWRKWFGYDQLHMISKELRRDPRSRRMVLTMWDGAAFGHRGRRGDLGQVVFNRGVDVPCNTHVYFEVKDGALNQTVCCRSNDIVWGAYGANAVHMSVLHEYVAALAGVAVGVYRQFSNNFHLYTALYSKDAETRKNLNAELEDRAINCDCNDLYRHGQVLPSTIINTPVADWEEDLAKFMMGLDASYQDSFFARCAVPMYKSWFARKSKHSDGLKELEPMRDMYDDWYVACRQWIERRAANGSN